DRHDWSQLEALGAMTADYARQFRDRALRTVAADGVDITDAAQVLLALRRTSMAELEQRVDLDAPDDLARLQPWKAKQVRRLAERLNAVAPRLAGLRVVLVVLEVHDLVRDALAGVLPRAGAEVILLGPGTSIDGIVRAATEEDADAIVVGVYNGNALELGERLSGGLRREGWRGTTYMGGILNQDTGDRLPIDARPGLEAAGVRCVETVEELLGLLATLSKA
ncbi:MAG TPA: cobalamin-dependent protein, partial [Ilumatobacteraceae bacterium]|nr:cobalamin-dependent protein [Ilumatobacteraceae bacterium]